jgi:hypothetical protein
MPPATDGRTASSSGVASSNPAPSGAENSTASAAASAAASFKSKSKAPPQWRPAHEEMYGVSPTFVNGVFKEATCKFCDAFRRETRGNEKRKVTDTIKDFNIPRTDL